MRIDKDVVKERRNLAKHKLDFSFAELIFADPLAVTLHDRYENGEHRWHTFGSVGGRLLLAVHTYPAPDRVDWIRVIGLREATSVERRRYEEGEFD